MEDVKSGKALTAAYSELYPFTTTVLPPQTYTFAITASITSGDSVSTTFTWTLNDPCTESGFFTLKSPEQAFTDDYSGMTQTWMPALSFENTKAICEPRIGYRCRSNVSATDPFTKVLCTNQKVKQGLDLTADYDTDLLPIGSSALPPQEYTFKVRARLRDRDGNNVYDLFADFTWTLSDPCLAAAQTLTAPASQTNIVDDYTGVEKTFVLTEFITAPRAVCSDRVTYQCVQVKSGGVPFTSPVLCDGTEDLLAGGLKLTADYNIAGPPFPSATLPAQVYRFIIEATAPDGVTKVRDKFNYRLRDPCRNQSLLATAQDDDIEDKYTGVEKVYTLNEFESSNPLCANRVTYACTGVTTNIMTVGSYDYLCNYAMKKE